MPTHTTSTDTITKKKQAQPRHHASKSKQAAALRRQRIVNGIIEGKTNKQAGIDAGLSPKTAPAQVTAILKEPETKLALCTALEKIGLTNDQVAQQHLELLNGNKYLPMRSAPDNLTSAAPGSVLGYIAVPDYQAKAKALEMFYKMSGAYIEKHELDIKRPVNIVIRKFCAPEEGKEESPVSRSTA